MSKFNYVRYKAHELNFESNVIATLVDCREPAFIVSGQVADQGLPKSFLVGHRQRSGSAVAVSVWGQ